MNRTVMNGHLKKHFCLTQKAKPKKCHVTLSAVDTAAEKLNANFW